MTKPRKWGSNCRFDGLGCPSDKVVGSRPCETGEVCSWNPNSDPVVLAAEKPKEKKK